MIRPRAHARRARMAACALLAGLAVPGPAHAGTKPWALDDILAVRTVSDPQVSPDGRWIAYTIQELTDDGAGYQTDVWLVPTAGGESRRLTASPVADESPRWSPDGRWIAFLSDRRRPGAKPGDPADEGRRQIWRIRPDGGEATPVTNAAGGVGAFEWSGDGRFIAYLSREPKSAERKQRERDGDDAWTPATLAAWDRLWTVDVATKQARQLTSGEFHVTGFAISPDGQRICVAAQPTSQLSDMFRSDLWMVPAAGGKPAPLVQRLGIDQSPRWSPDGRWIAFESQDGRDAEWWTNVYLCVVNAAGGQPVNLTKEFDERPNEGPVMAGATPVWTNDSQAILFQSLWRTSTQIFRASALEPEVKPVTRGSDVCTSPSLGGPTGTLAYVRQDAEHPADVWLWEPGTAAPRQVTDANPEVRERLSFAKTVVRWKSADGLDIDGLLISPQGGKPGAPAPLVVNLHGGPAGSHVNTFTAGSRGYPWPLFAQRGFAVLLPNPRGSGGYGEKFRGGNRGDWGGRDGDDVLRGVNTLISLGLVDSTRMAVCGWSYGGFLTADLVTKTNRFRAAVVGAGMSNLTSLTGTSDIGEIDESYLGGWPWTSPATYTEHSPLFRAASVKTPTAFVHGGADERVPPSQAWEFYNALKRVGVPTDILILPRQPHAPDEPRMQRANMQWQLDWITKWTLGTPAPAPSATHPRAGHRPGASGAAR